MASDDDPMLVCSAAYYQSVLNELKFEDHQGFKNFACMSPYDFENLLKMIAPVIKLED
jgi:hypothetical protein